MSEQFTKLKDEATNIIMQSVNARRNDVIEFVGSGSTAALHRIVRGLKIDTPRVAASTAIVLGPYEHHSNILLWKVYGTSVIRIRDVNQGYVNLYHLEQILKTWTKKKRYVIVCMSVCSDVTGILTDTELVAHIAHKYGAYAIFDYTNGGPYLRIDMNPSETTYKDAIVLSPHKFIGGPGTPGIVVAKEWMLDNFLPGRKIKENEDLDASFCPFNVSRESKMDEKEMAIGIGIIRAGLVFKLKNEIGTDVILNREEDICMRALGIWEGNPSIIILGSHTVERVAIFSIMVKHEKAEKFIHHNFIAILLNDIFGIQVKGGRTGSGPYTADLFGMPEFIIKRFYFAGKPNAYYKISAPEVEIMKPGFTRINIPFYYDDITIDYVIRAVDMVATHGWKLLPKYEFNIENGSWQHIEFIRQSRGPQFKSLGDVLFVGKKKKQKKKKIEVPTLAEVYIEAQKILDNENIDPEVEIEALQASKNLYHVLPQEKRILRFFVTPKEASDILKSNIYQKRPFPLPFKFRQQTLLYRTNDNKANMDYLISWQRPEELMKYPALHRPADRP